MRDYVEYLDKISSGINDIENTTHDSDSDAIYTLQGIRSNANKVSVSTMTYCIYQKTAKRRA